MNGTSILIEDFLDHKLIELLQGEPGDRSNVKIFSDHPVSGLLGSPCT